MEQDLLHLLYKFSLIFLFSMTNTACLNVVKPIRVALGLSENFKLCVVIDTTGGGVRGVRELQNRTEIHQ